MMKMYTEYTEICAYTLILTSAGLFIKLFDKHVNKWDIKFNI